MRNWKDLLKRLKHEHIKATAPGFFELSGGYQMKVKPYRDDKANGLTTAIIDFITFIGGDANRINTQGQLRKIRGEMKWTYGSTRKGTADIHGIFQGLHISIEIKIGLDYQSDAQRREMQRVVNAGGIYIVAKSFPQFLTAFICYFPNVKQRLHAFGFDVATMLYHANPA